MSEEAIIETGFKDISVLQRYQNANQLVKGVFKKTFVLNSTIFPNWIRDSSCFWYERELNNGKNFCLVNSHTGDNIQLFDHKALAESLANASGCIVEAVNLPITKLTVDLEPLSIRFLAFNRRWVFNATSASCIEVDVEPLISAEINDWVISPNDRYAVFLRDFDLWLIDIDSMEERALTQDGEEDNAYGVAGTAWGGLPGVVSLQALWSPDSRKVYVAQRDRRKVKKLPIVHHVPCDGSLRPELEYLKISYPGDRYIETLKLSSIDIDTGRKQEADYAEIPVTRNDFGLFTSNLAWWAIDSIRAFFIDLSRDYKTAKVVEFNVETGSTKVLFTETSETQINLMLHGDERPTLMPLLETNELIWFSERSGWAHLYLYDLDSGALKKVVSEGDWVVRDVVFFDSKRREIFIQTAGRVSNRDPYYRDLVRINIDSGRMVTIVSSDHEYVVTAQRNHNMDTMKAFFGGSDIGDDVCGVSHSGDFIVTTYSRADQVPITLLVDRNGKEILEVERADVSALPNSWQWPEPVQLIAADGETDIYGLVFRPSDFNPEKSYPVISHVFSTPDYPWVSKGSFRNGVFIGWPYLDAAALAELGFIVVQIDGRGLPFRSKAFHDMSYGCLESASLLDDHVAGIRQLAQRYSYIDLDRVGITSHLGGGPGGAQGLLHYPDFYKVGVTTAMHDSRLMTCSMWGDKYEGMSGPTDDSYYPEQFAKNLKGKLLLMGGMVDKMTPPASTFRLVEALFKENKDFDMIMLPNLGHDFIPDYFLRKTWDYFVVHLLGEDPPADFQLSD